MNLFFGLICCVTMLVDQSAGSRKESKELQINNYNNDRAHSVLMNIHITHHAGTQFCALARQNGKVPSTACNVDHKTNGYVFQVESWAKEWDTIGWEFKSKPNPPLETHQWEHPHVISVIIMRNPLERLLSGDGMVSSEFGNHPTMLNPDQMWAYANSKYTDNYALSILSGGDSSETGLFRAKDLLRRFTYVLDLTCLDDGLLALCNALHWECGALTEKSGLHRHHKSLEERYTNKTLLAFLTKRNKYDLELYHWSKTLSLVECEETLDGSVVFEEKIKKTK
eukprot:m.64640 g.64640  ORF g.64640 m.64640 type:complete len:282 (-) comp23456_c0_seq2:154-999(-)